MDQKQLWQQLSALPPEAQHQVVDFIAFLRTRYTPLRPRKAAKRSKLVDEPFIGIWRDRSDLQDSTAWVRQAREREWTKRRG
jgi:Protein of unknown function (DUF2281)